MNKLLGIVAAIGVLLCTAGQASADADLTVESGPHAPGAPVAVTGTGFFCTVDDVGPPNDTVKVLWESEPAETTPSSPQASKGVVRFTLKIPANASSGDKEITAGCGNVTRQAIVTVQRLATLSVSPGKGSPGLLTTLHGENFECRVVQTQWDDDQPIDVLTNKGTFDVDVQVPADAADGTHTISAQCVHSNQPPARVDFTVVRPQTTTTTPPPTTTSTTPPTTTSTSTATPPIESSPHQPTTSDRHRALLPQSMASASDITRDPITYLVLLAVGGFFALLIFLPLIAFPAEIFNKALEERHERQDRLRLPSWLQVTLFTVTAGILLALIEPEAAFDRKTVALGTGLMIAVCVTTLSYSTPGERFSFWVSRQRAVLRTLPYALLIACLCAIVSRIADFQPGYVYGLIAGYAPVARTLGADDTEHRRNEARSILLGVFLTLTLSLVAWLLWDRIDAAAENPAATFGMLVADSTLSAIALMGVETVLFGLIPLRFLDGLKLVAASPGTWMTIYALTTTAYLFLLTQESEPTTPAAILHAMALFLAFGACSFAFWSYVVMRERRARLRS